MLDEQAQLAVIRGLRAGSRDAWARLYDAYSMDVWRYVARLVGADLATVSDVVQEIFMEAAASAQRFDAARGTLWAWLAGIAHHRVSAHRRQAGRATRLRQQFEAHVTNREPPDGQPSQALIEREETAAVRAILTELTYDYAALLTARYLDDHTLAELAQQWGSTSEAIKSKLARARREFRATYERRSAAAAHVRKSE